MFAPDARAAIAAIPRRNRVLIAGCIAVLSALAWAYLVHLAGRMSPAPDAAAAMSGMAMPMDAPWRVTDVALTFAMWSVMMVGMMGPAAAPMLLLLAASNARRRGRGASGIVAPFGIGYLTVWVGFSASATVAQWALSRATLLSPAMAVTSPRIAGAVLIAAGLYQLTPLKNACLRHCQTPMGFLMSHWRDGPAGAFRMGVHHGVYCFGCCWALMAVLFAVGVMNLAWVGVLTVFILLERVGRGGSLVARVGGVAMAGLGIALIVAGR